MAAEHERRTTNSPWAKLIVCDVCQSNVNLTAIKA
jgi:hypothetical protein